MISKKMQDALNSQLNYEMYSAYIYASMEGYFQSINLKGCANWMRVQIQEEMVHATKFYDYINARQGRVILAKIDAPKTDWKAPIEAFKDAYAHEQKVTARINNLVNLAITSKDHAAQQFLQWFVNEQVEEEESVNDVIQKLKLAGGAAGGLFMIDQELAKRVFTSPATGGAAADQAP
jgi:ferritin